MIEKQSFNVRLLSAGPFVSMVDRFAIAPLIIPIASEFRVSLGAAAMTATLYFLLYGLLQTFWGLLSDHAGRIRTIRISLGVLAAGCALSALAPNFALVLVARMISGAAVCAVVPTTLVYVGDMVPFRARHAVIADVLAAVAVGTALGTLSAGVLAHFSWRLAFILPAVCAGVLLVLFGRLPESMPQVAGKGPREQLRRAVNGRWARFLILFGLPEGAVVLGFFVYFAPALESTGHSPATAGLVVASYGVAVLCGTQIVRRITRRITASISIALGGVMIAAAYVGAAADQHVPGMLLASLLIGAGYAFMHSTIQTWATEIAPDARGTAAALFVTAAFTGAAAGAAAGAQVVQAGNYRLLFLVAAGITVPVVLVGAVARAYYPEAQSEAAALSGL